ncbi:hypothetical protein Syun_022656 [Stephania yunnanensis]|uniref:Secreted protein n=1 Tax=Stephania yunnanensis TaxID=152371 RepID=A0AAP0F7D7_9MAGN
MWMLFLATLSVRSFAPTDPWGIGMSTRRIIILVVHMVAKVESHDLTFGTEILNLLHKAVLVDERRILCLQPFVSERQGFLFLFTFAEVQWSVTLMDQEIDVCILLIEKLQVVDRR